MNGDRKKLSLEPRLLSEIGEAMADSQSDSFLDIEKKEVIRIVRGFFSTGQDEEILERMEESKGTRYLSIPNHESWLGYEDMRAFVASIKDPSLQDRLAAAIEGHGAFRRFKDILLNHEAYHEQWFVFLAARQETRARDWLRVKGFDVSVEWTSVQLP